MAKTKIRPLGTADLLDETVELFKSNFALFMGISMAVQLPVRLLYAFSHIYRGHSSAVFPSSIICCACAPLVASALIYAAADRHLGVNTSLSSCYRRSLTRVIYWSVFGVDLLQGLLLWGCVIVAAIPGMIVTSVMAAAGVARSQLITPIGITIAIGLIALSPLWVRFMVAGPAAVIEKQGSASAVGRSWKLTRGAALRSALVIVVSFLLVHGIPVVLGQLVGPLTGHRNYYDVPLVYRVVHQGIGTLVDVALGPVVLIAQTLLYFDLRVRKEGFDLEMLARDIEQKGPALT